MQSQGKTSSGKSDSSLSKSGEKKNNYSLKLTQNNIDEASITNYKLLKTIGCGLYSKVKLAASKEHSNQFYAIKIIKRHHVEKVSLKVFQ